MKKLMSVGEKVNLIGWKNKRVIYLISFLR